MTQLIDVTKTCAICGKPSRHRDLMSTNAFGSADLDLRPPEMERSTMFTWIQACPFCGYAAEDLESPTLLPKSFLQEESYKNCEGIPFTSGLAKAFYRFSMISRHLQDTEDEFYALLHAAWASDDEESPEIAKRCRELAIPPVTALIENGDNKDTLLLMKADLLRRSGQFDTLLSEYRNTRFSEDLLNQILAFEFRKAEEKDTACYTVEDAVKAEG